MPVVIEGPVAIIELMVVVVLVVVVVTVLLMIKSTPAVVIVAVVRGGITRNLNYEKTPVSQFRG